MKRLVEFPLDEGGSILVQVDEPESCGTARRARPPQLPRAFTGSFFERGDNGDIGDIGDKCRSTRANTFQIRRFASQTKPMEDCHPERSEGSLSGERSFAALRMTKRDGLLFEMYCPQGHPVWGAGNPSPPNLAPSLRTR